MPERLYLYDIRNILETAVITLVDKDNALWKAQKPFKSAMRM